jgi:DNA invertase Pin-like site-specific DNA recombinase
MFNPVANDQRRYLVTVEPVIKADLRIVRFGSRPAVGPSRRPIPFLFRSCAVRGILRPMTTRPMTPRAAIYARYSSDRQREASIEDQVRLCRGWVEREGALLVGTYTDHAVSGQIRMRPGYQKLLEDARAGEFDVVVAEAVDRLSRDQEDVAGLFKHLRYAGVRLVTLAEGEISELHVGLKGTMNALFLKDFAAKTHRGLHGRIEAGRSAGGRAYGYKVVRELDGRGGPVRGRREVELVGEIAAMVAAAQSSAGARQQKAAPVGAALGPDVVRSVKVVAGTRNQRCLHLLRARVPRVPRLAHHG